MTGSISLPWHLPQQASQNDVGFTLRKGSAKIIQLSVHAEQVQSVALWKE
jgi:hypothetical protein